MRTPDHAVKPLKQYRGQEVWLVHRPDEAPRTLKRWTLTPVLLLKLGLGIAQPQRQVRGAHRLQRAGLRTPPPLGGLRLAWHGMPVIEIEMPFVEGRSALDLARDEHAVVTDPHALSSRVGRVVAAMSDSGLFNRDIKLANLIVDDDGEVWQIDTVGVRLSRRKVREVGRMLERLAVQLPAMGDRVTPAVWMPAMRVALRPLGRERRRAALRWLRSHRQRQSS